MARAGGIGQCTGQAPPAASHNQTFYTEGVQAHWRQTTVGEHGELVLEGLPFEPVQPVEVLVVSKTAGSATAASRSLRDSVLEFRVGAGCQRLGRLAVILLDTHVWVWWVSRPERRQSRHRDLLELGTDRVFGVSCWEVAKLVEYGKLKLDRTVGLWMESALAGPGVSLLHLHPRIVVESTQLPQPFLIGDPTRPSTWPGVHVSEARIPCVEIAAFHALSRARAVESGLPIPRPGRRKGLLILLHPRVPWTTGSRGAQCADDGLRVTLDHGQVGTDGDLRAPPALLPVLQ
jgi:PIN domain nuclease of toxin-antitoxin system